MPVAHFGGIDRQKEGEMPNPVEIFDIIGLKNTGIAALPLKIARVG